jgi:hypothetical protein
MNCCVCYEEKESYFNCNTCEEGKICLSCCLKLGCNCFGHMPRDILLKRIACPCCRTPNWKIVFDCILFHLTKKYLIDYYHHPTPLGRLFWEQVLLEELSYYPKQYYILYKNGRPRVSLGSYRLP